MAADGYVPICLVVATFQATKGYRLPIILSLAVTAYALEETTLNRAMIDFGKKNFARDQCEKFRYANILYL